MSVKEFPRFVWMDVIGNCAMIGNGRKDGSNHAYYYRDGGEWGIDAKWSEDGILITYGNEYPTDHLNDRVLIPCTEEEWRKDNGRYARSLKNTEPDDDDDELAF